ncbi:MAG: flagellar basal body L-ring protein FlgH [Lysobacteraceae bacterium]
MNTVSPFRVACRRVAGLAVLAILAPALASCAAVGRMSGDVHPFAPVSSYAAVPAAPIAAARGAPASPSAQPAYAGPQAGDGGGSIYASAGSQSMRLFEDNKARNVGDLLTILLVENTAAKTNAQTAVNKDNSLGMAAPTIAGQSVTWHGKNLLEAEVDGSRKFSGSGDSTQSNQLNGQITVRVVQDLGNGNLLVRGDKQLRLNQGDELVQIQGIVRVADISPDNRITSDRVGDAQIVYGGRGTLARSNAMGWLGRFFNSALFPY